MKRLARVVSNRWLCVAGSALVAASAALVPTAASAQDAHYWTNQYGNEARLLGGAAIGSSRDLSAVFYNPGRLALVERPEFVIAGNVFEYGVARVKTEDGESVSSNRFALSPSLLAGELRFGFLGDKGRLAYSFLTRQLSDIRMFTGTTQPIAGGGEVDALGSIDHRLSEYWAGLTYAHTLGDNFGLGVSTFVAPRSHRSATSVSAFGVSEDEALVTSLSESYEYYQWSLLWKVGIGTTIDVWDVGLTVTTPQVKLFGSGKVSGTLVNLGTQTGGETIVASDFQDDLSTQLKSPWSIGIGGSREFGASRLHLGIEWFSSVGEYKVMEAQPTTIGIGLPEDADLSVVDGRDSVLNFALGFERRESERLKWYASVHSDFSYDDAERGTSLAFTRWNLWHVGGGTRISFGNNELTLGAIYAFSNSTPTRNLGQTSSTSYRRLTFILGFNLPFGDNPTTG